MKFKFSVSLCLCVERIMIVLRHIRKGGGRGRLLIFFDFNNHPLTPSLQRVYQNSNINTENQRHRGKNKMKFKFSVSLCLCVERIMIVLRHIRKGGGRGRLLIFFDFNNHPITPSLQRVSQNSNINTENQRH
jgi:hypothetical protein